MSAKGKGDTAGTLLRICRLMRFLSGKGERGAVLEEIRTAVYEEDAHLSPESFRRKFNRDCHDVKEFHNVLWSGDDESAGDVPDTVDIIRVRAPNGENRYILKGSSFFTVPLSLSKDEVYVLSSGIELSRHFISSFDGSAKRLSEKLKRSVPRGVMSIGEGLSRALALSMPVSRTERDSGDAMRETLRAMDEEKPLQLWDYRDMSGRKISPRVIYPYLLFFKHHSWYTLAGSDEPGESVPGPYRLSRMRHVEVLNGAPFVRSRRSTEELQRDIALDYHPANPDGEYRIKLKIHGAFANTAHDTEWFEGQMISPQPDGGIIYEVSLKGLEAITLWIMRALESIEVLEPAELRDEIDRRVGMYCRRRDGGAA